MTKRGTQELRAAQETRGAPRRTRGTQVTKRGTQELRAAQETRGAPRYSKGKGHPDDKRGTQEGEGHLERTEGHLEGKKNQKGHLSDSVPRV